MTDTQSDSDSGSASGGGRRAFQERLDRIAALFTDIVAHAEVSSRTRCPYRNRHDLCTALFRCRNQLSAGGDRLACGHDGTFDYRSAWEAHPRAGARAKEKIAAIKDEAEARRRNGSKGPGKQESGKAGGW